MRLIIALLAVLPIAAQVQNISDTLTNAVGGAAWTGRITVTLNAPSQAYYLTTSLSGWQYTLCVGVTGTDCTAAVAAGVVSIPVYATTTLTPSGLSYSARYAPTRGAARTETWVVAAGNTKLYEIISSVIPTTTVTFATTQLSGGAAVTGQCLYFNGTHWAPRNCIVTSTWDQLTGVTWNDLQ